MSGLTDKSQVMKLRWTFRVRLVEVFNVNNTLTGICQMFYEVKMKKVGANRCRPFQVGISCVLVFFMPQGFGAYLCARKCSEMRNVIADLSPCRHRSIHYRIYSFCKSSSNSRTADFNKNRSGFRRDPAFF